MARRSRPSIICRVTNRGLEPAGPYDAEVLSQYKIGSDVGVEFKQPRKKELNAKYWSVLNRVVENTDWPTAAALSKALLIKFKHVGYMRTFGEGAIIEPASLTELDDEEFSRFFDQAVDFICAEVVPGLSREALTEERRFVVSDEDDL